MSRRKGACTRITGSPLGTYRDEAERLIGPASRKPRLRQDRTDHERGASRVSWTALQVAAQRHRRHDQPDAVLRGALRSIAVPGLKSMAIRVALTHQDPLRLRARRALLRRRWSAFGPRRTRARRSTAIRCASSRRAKHFLNWQQDPHGNFLARVVVPEHTHRVLGSTSIWWPISRRSIRSTSSSNPSAEKYPFVYPDELRQELAPYLAHRAGRRASRTSSRSWTVDAGGERSVDFLVEDEPSRVSMSVDYVIRLEAGRADAGADARRSGAGSCRDSSWLLVQVLRISASPRASCPAI